MRMSLDISMQQSTHRSITFYKWCVDIVMLTSTEEQNGDLSFHVEWVVTLICYSPWCWAMKCLWKTMLLGRNNLEWANLNSNSICNHLINDTSISKLPKKENDFLAEYWNSTYLIFKFFVDPLALRNYFYSSKVLVLKKTSIA